MPKISRLLIALFALGSGGAVVFAETTAPSARLASFDQFVASAAATCLNRAAEVCIDAGWQFADADGDGGLTSEEMNAIRATVGDWYAWRQESLTRQERSAIALGLLLADSVGLDQLIAGFDTNGDTRVTRPELLADIRLDDRPLGQILLDPEAVDRAAVGRRLGAAAPLLNGLLK